MFKNTISALLLVALAVAVAADAQPRPWMNKADPPAVRAQKLLSQMTLDEKIVMLHGPVDPVPCCECNESQGPLCNYTGNVYPNARLGIPQVGLGCISEMFGFTVLPFPFLFHSLHLLPCVFCHAQIKMNDGPQGFRDNANPGTSTAWPSAMTVGATWDTDLVYKWGEAMGKVRMRCDCTLGCFLSDCSHLLNSRYSSLFPCSHARACQEFFGKGANIQLGPGVNVARVPRNGRNFEYLSGEDPFLGYTLVQPAVQGIQSQGVIANAKHYVLNNQETNRVSVSDNADERTRFEMYYLPFLGAVEAGVGSFMVTFLFSFVILHLFSCFSRALMSSPPYPHSRPRSCLAQCSYNKIFGTWACENDLTLNQDLKVFFCRNFCFEFRIMSAERNEKQN